MSSPSCLPTNLLIPERLAPSAWTEHLPFGMWLVGAIKPRVLVELGLKWGTSYCGFCQVVAAHGLLTKCYGVDTWEGDPHADHYGPEVLNSLKRYHDLMYGSFSALLQMTFDEAVGRFDDGSIDLLHIDGYHTYEAVRHDFETWLPKLSNRAVVLFHDTAEHHADFGVWRLWDELTGRHPSFSFAHGHGLGVLAVGRNQPRVIRSLTKLSPTEADVVRAFFYDLGRRLLPDFLEETD
jgi:Methyltransferase domain